MKITEVRIKLMEDPGERLKAFCSITFDDCFVIRDLKIIEGTNGPFVAMPSRKLTAHCPKCRSKNHLRAVHCNQCGGRLDSNRSLKDEQGRARLYADIAHPINSDCRELIQKSVILEFHKEIDLAKKPGYASRYDDFDHPLEAVVTPDLPGPDLTEPDLAEPPLAEPVKTSSSNSAIRVDAPHPADVTNPPHTAKKTSTPSFEKQEQPLAPHHRIDKAKRGPSSAPKSIGPKGDGFGAGLFPEKK